MGADPPSTLPSCTRDFWKSRFRATYQVVIIAELVPTALYPQDYLTSLGIVTRLDLYPLDVLWISNVDNEVR